MSPQSPSTLDSVLASGSMAPTIRPKSRFIDRVLMQQRGNEQTKAQNDLANLTNLLMPQQGAEGSTAGMFGGSSNRPFTSPSTAGLYLGGR